MLRRRLDRSGGKARGEAGGERVVRLAAYLLGSSPTSVMHPALTSPCLRTSLKLRASGTVDARCVSPPLIRHAQVPSGAAAMLVSTKASPRGSAVITTRPASLTPTPAIPSPKVEQAKRTIGSAWHTAAAAPILAPTVRPRDRFSERLDRRIDARRLALVARQGLDIVPSRRDGRTTCRREQRQGLDVQRGPWPAIVLNRFDG